MLNQLELAILKALDESDMMHYDLMMAIGEPVTLTTLCDMEDADLVIGSASAMWSITDRGITTLRSAQAFQGNEAVRSLTTDTERAVSDSADPVACDLIGYTLSHGDQTVSIIGDHDGVVVLTQGLETILVTPELLRALTDKAEELV